MYLILSDYQMGGRKMKLGFLLCMLAVIKKHECMLYV